MTWQFCPECGCEEVRYEEGRHKQCARCGQEWFSDIDYLDVVARNLRRLSASPQREGWRDISTAPKDGTAVLVWSDDTPIPETVCFLNGSKISVHGWYPYAGGNWFVPEAKEHELVWQPLPTPPKEG